MALKKKYLQMKPQIVEAGLLMKMELLKGEKEGKSWEAAKLLFKKNDSWVEGWIFNPKQHMYDSKVKYNNARARAQAMLENVAMTYLDGEDLLELYRSSVSFSDYITHMIDRMKEEEFWRTPVDFKVLPKNGKSETALSTPFMRLHGDTTIRLGFSNYELEKIVNQ